MAPFGFKSRVVNLASNKSKTKRSSRSYSDNSNSSSCSKSSLISLGTGFMANDGSISFLPSPTNKHAKREGSTTSLTAQACSSITKKLHQVSSASGAAAAVAAATPTAAVQKILRISCSFLRVADLGMDDDNVLPSGDTIAESSVAMSSLSSTTSQREPNIHHAAVDPPPGIDLDPKEKWIALTTDTDGSHAPIAPIAMNRLANFGFTTSLNGSMWIPDSKTEKILKRQGEDSWLASTFRPGKIQQSVYSSNAAYPEDAQEVLVWSGSFKHGFYGSDLPAIRAAGIVNMSAKALMELLVDSTRVKEYNKLSLGRDDLVTFDGDLQTPGPFGRSITKVMKSESKPPMIRKNLVFVSILHAKELVDGSGYLIVTRAVHRPEEEKSMANSIQSEILMGVNLIRKVEGAEDSTCLMINVNHIRSPMIPMMVAKRIGVSSAIGFVNDIRALCS